MNVVRQMALMLILQERKLNVQLYLERINETVDRKQDCRDHAARYNSKYHH
jgi:hypothetical protein